jgi:hypothetical protein
MNTTISLSYIKGIKNAKRTLDISIKDGILFSAELIVLSILLLIYSGVISTLSVIVMITSIILLISSIISRYVFMNKVSSFYKIHPDNKVYVTDDGNSYTINYEEYVDDSMSLLKLGTYTAIINIITTVISILTLLILIVGLLN